jgi:hypothetical protein
MAQGPIIPCPPNRVPVTVITQVASEVFCLSGERRALPVAGSILSIAHAISLQSSYNLTGEAGVEC